jgi:leucyl/phenylalanyl-tRNA--protein transferase
MIAAYTRLHALGLAHSVESWQDGELVGGLYGVRLGRVFFGESMFSLERDASKAALASLVSASLARNDRLIDCQVASRHLETLGARSVPRAQFVAELDAAIVDVHADASWPQSRVPLP